MNIIKKLFGKRKSKSGSIIVEKKVVKNLALLSKLCREMGNIISEKVPREKEALIWYHSTIVGGGTYMAEAMQLKQKYLPRVERAAALFLGRSVQIVASPANNYWKDGRPSEQKGHTGKIVEFQYDFIAHRDGFSGASFMIEWPDGNKSCALVEEIKIISG